MPADMLLHVLCVGRSQAYAATATRLEENN